MTKTQWAVAASQTPRTLAEKAYDALHGAIVSGDIAPGERLRIESLAAMLGMSHLPIREAIRRLESDGLVAHVPHRGASVVALSLDDLRELYDARLLLEPAIIRRSAASFNESDAAVARAALDRQTAAEEARAVADGWTAHTEFHAALYEPSKAHWLLHFVRPLWDSSQRYRMAVTPLRSDERRREAHAEHLQLLDACLAGDGERAAHVLYNHLVKTANLVTDAMGGEYVFAFK